MDKYYGKLRVELEVRNSKTETIPYMDKRTGRRTSFSRFLLGCESLSDGSQIVVSLPIPDGVTVETAQAPASRGQKIIAFPQSVEIGNGGVMAIRAASIVNAEAGNAK